jgi:hypothetical protein
MLSVNFDVNPLVTPLIFKKEDEVLWGSPPQFLPLKKRVTAT